MNQPTPFSKTIVEFDRTASATAVHLPIEPHGLALFVAPDTSPASNQLIDEVVTVWPLLWPKMSAYLETEMEAYGVEATLGTDELMGSMRPMTPGVFMGEQSDTLIRVEFDEPPLWDFFIRGSTIVHSQPVF